MDNIDELQQAIELNNKILQMITLSDMNGHSFIFEYRDGTRELFEFNSDIDVKLLKNRNQHLQNRIDDIEHPMI